YFWVPGNWSFADGNYTWMPGEWVEAQPDWVWNPVQYHWTPNGLVFSEGFWDFPATTRGVTFSPVSADVSSIEQYTPQNVVPVGPMLTNLFTREGSTGYFFGN